MNPETILLEAWLKAGLQAEGEPACPSESVLVSLVTRQLPEEEASGLAMHMADCQDCRRAVAMLAKSRAIPTRAGASITELLSSNGITPAWRDWVRNLISCLPQDDDDLAVSAIAGYEELSPVRIDDLGRLIVELAPEHPVPAGSRVHLALINEGARLDLCDVTAGARGIYAVVDLSAFDPRPGVVRAGVLAAEPAPAPAKPVTMLSLLAAIQNEQLYGTEFWDRFAPIAALGNRLAAHLAHEIAAEEGDRTTRSPHLRSGAAPETDRTPLGRVQYALNTLEEFAALWRECNGTPLEGAAECVLQLRALLSPSMQTETEQTVIPASKPMPAEDTARAVPVQRNRKETP